jgi:HlyD family secretion protein
VGRKTSIPREADLQKKIDNFRPSPGMPADVFIETGQRTFLNYLIRVSDSLSRAFREH